MIKTRYAEKVREVVKIFDPKGSNRYFLFGSAVREERYGDIDLGVAGNQSSNMNLGALRDQFYESSIPYKVDVVDFDAADEDFKDYVTRNEQIVWLP